jgi:soluble lytic murein transglycosylase-like protein
MDAGRTARPNVKLAREALRANPRLAPIDALLLATDVVDAAEDHGLPVGFLGATLLQESAFDPGAMSSAGAVGIAQFTLPTAAAAGIDPWNPQQAIGGAAALLSSYVRAYGGANDDPYALALAAYDAGPGAVAAYHGVPPYAETRAYIIDVGGPGAGRGGGGGRASSGAKAAEGRSTRPGSVRWSSSGPNV